MFVRRKQDWRQEYFYLVTTYRYGTRVRQWSWYLGKTLKLSAAQWDSLLRPTKIPKKWKRPIDIWRPSKRRQFLKLVQRYVKQWGLPLDTTDGLRDWVQMMADEEAQQRAKDEADVADFFGKPFNDVVNALFGRQVDTTGEERLLGLRHNASAIEVKAAFRERAKTCHPDVGGSTEQMIALSKARDVLLASARP